MNVVAIPAKGDGALGGEQNSLPFSGSQLVLRSNTVYSFHCCQTNVTETPYSPRYFFVYLEDIKGQICSSLEEGRESTGDHLVQKFCIFMLRGQ